MKVVVTGAAGYIGSVLVPLLLDKNHSVKAIDRFFFGPQTLPAGKGSLETVDADIRFMDPDIFDGADAIIDLAALSNDPAGDLDPIKTYSINHLGRVRVALLAKSRGVKRYILPSSCSIYGFQEGIVHEESPVNPLTAYAKANYMAEKDILLLADKKFCVTIIRQATVYGLSRRMRFDLAINGMVRGFYKNGKIPILRDGSQWRPFVHVKDTARAMSILLESPTSMINREYFNVGSEDQNYQVFDLAKKVSKAIGIDFAFEWYGAPDHRSYKVDFTKIRSVLKYTPEFRAEDGAREIWEALQEKKIDPDDPKTITVQWYKKLLAEGVLI